MEIERLNSKRRQLLDREMDVQAKGLRKSVKAIQDKLDTEISAHKQTIKALNKLSKVVGRSEGIIQRLRKVTTKKHEWYEEQIENKHRLSKEAQEGLHKEMDRLEELHEKVSKLWQEVKSPYEM